MFEEEFKDLRALFIHELQDLYDAEQRLTEAIPKMAEAADSEMLKSAFNAHLSETQTQVQRLEKVFGLLDLKPEGETCPAMKGLISEGENMLKAKGDSHVRDAAIIGAAQRVEHYEMAAYGTTRTLAAALGLTEIEALLQQTLDEEGAADKKLTEIAQTVVNPEAKMA